MSINPQKDFDIVSVFHGYQARLDITNLVPGVLIPGSQNVMTRTTGRVGIIRGYTLDGQAGTAISAGIENAFDYDTNFGAELHLRSYTDPATSHGVVQFRYVNPVSGAITWETLSHALARGLVRYTRFFDFNSEKNDLCLMVDGSSNVYEWSGAVGSYASCTANTITKSGTKSFGEEGWYALGNKKIMLGGVEYTYTGGESTATLTGVTPDPTGGSQIVGDPMFQSIVVVPNSSITVLPDTFENGYIATLRNQVYYGSEIDNSIYISKTDNYKDCTVSTPRVVAEGGLLHLDAVMRGFVAQEDSMYITAGKNQWYNTKFTLSSDNAKEEISIERLKTASNQGAFSQELITNDKNNIIFVSNEPVLTSIGRVATNLTTPKSEDYSWPIIDDFNSYDFTGGSAKYHKNFIYVSVPTSSVVRVFNQTKSDNQYWEAPLTYPVAMFSVIDGELYGHSFSNPETYKLFDGGSFNGASYTAVAKFSYMNYGSRTNSKGFSQIYSEGYISSNTKPLIMGNIYEVDGCATTQEFQIDGDNTRYVCVYKSDAPLGKVSLGTNPLGGSKNSVPTLPPKFRIINTLAPLYFYEHSIYYKTSAIDANWEILAFGVRRIKSSDLNNDIKI